VKLEILKFIDKKFETQKKTLENEILKLMEKKFDTQNNILVNKIDKIEFLLGFFFEEIFNIKNKTENKLIKFNGEKINSGLLKFLIEYFKNKKYFDEDLNKIKILNDKILNNKEDNEIIEINAFKISSDFLTLIELTIKDLTNEDFLLLKLFQLEKQFSSILKHGINEIKKINNIMLYGIYKETEVNKKLNSIKCEYGKYFNIFKNNVTYKCLVPFRSYF
jgi:hypothetical protein